MLGPVRMGVAARLLAAVVAVALSGAPRLVAALRPDGEHVCQCRAHGGERHRCACPVCAALAREARRGAIDELPPCHRERARAELDEEEERERQASTLPGLVPTCGTEEARATVPVSDTYLAPRPPSLAAARWVERLLAPAGRAAELPAAPDVPPPRRA